MNILYIHGLQSSGQSGTAERLREMLPEATVFSPDIPVEADAAVNFIKDFVQNNNIGLVIGTSMGGMLAQLLRGIPKIIVNPSFHVSQSMRKKIGIVPFYSRRSDGATEYEITPELCDVFEKIEKNQFTNISELDITNTFGLFGTNDDVVNCRDEYLQHYSNCQTMVCGHRLTEEAVRNYLVPLIKSIENTANISDTV